MPGVASYSISFLALLVLIGSLGVAAVRIRRHFIPAWNGGITHLVEIVIGLSILILTAELLGLFGILYGWALTAVIVLVAAGSCTRYFEAPAISSEQQTVHPKQPMPLDLLALAIVAVVFLQWALAVHHTLDNGFSNFDSLWYHMPSAASIAQRHSVTMLTYTGTVFTNLNWLYPENSELIHAVSLLVVHRDTLSPMLNLGWLLLAFLSAWCIGKPVGRGAISVIGVAVVLDAPTMLVREAGSAKNDVMAAALLLASVAIVVHAMRSEETAERTGWPIVAAGLAIGLAVGTKVTVLPIGLALTVAVIVLAGTGHRTAAALRWCGAAFVAGGYWFLRNLVVAHNPMPQLDALGPVSLPHPAELQKGWPDYSILHYGFNASVWHEYFEPGLKLGYGVLWPVVLAVGIAGGLMMLLFQKKRLGRWLGALVIVGGLAYLVTPQTAAGPPGEPINFWLNVRFLAPALLVGLAILPLHPLFSKPEVKGAAAAGLILILLITDKPTQLLEGGGQIFAVVLCLLILVVPAAILFDRRRNKETARFAVEIGVVLFVVGILGFFVQRDYLRARFVAGTGLPGYGMEDAYRWASSVENARIGLAGTTAGFVAYGFYGPDLSNTVRYIGEPEAGGSFNALATCGTFRERVNKEQLRYLVTAPFLNFRNAAEPLFSPEGKWMYGDPAVNAIQSSYGITVWQIHGALNAKGCDSSMNAPLTYIPQQPY